MFLAGVPSASISPMDREGEFETALAFGRRLAADRATDVVPVPGGTAVLSRDFPYAHDHNRLLIDRPCSVPDLVAAADRVLGGAHLEHRLVEVHAPGLAGALRAGLQDAGYSTSDEVVMAAGEVSASGTAAAGVVELDLPERAAVATADWRREQPGWGDDVLDQLGGRISTVVAAAEVIFLGVRDEDGAASPAWTSTAEARLHRSRRSGRAPSAAVVGWQACSSGTRWSAPGRPVRRRCSSSQMPTTGRGGCTGGWGSGSAGQSRPSAGEAAVRHAWSSWAGRRGRPHPGAPSRRARARAGRWLTVRATTASSSILVRTRGLTLSSGTASTRTPSRASSSVVSRPSAGSPVPAGACRSRSRSEPGRSSLRATLPETRRSTMPYRGLPRGPRRARRRR